MHLTDFFKGSQMQNESISKELHNPFACDADQCFDTKVKCLIGRFGLNPLLYRAKLQSNAEGMPGGTWAGLELIGTLSIPSDKLPPNSLI